MNFDRIRPSIDIDRMQTSHATIVGGAYGLTSDLVRCGLGSLIYIDFDRVDATNPARQDFNLADVGQPKAEALAASLKRINPDVEVNYLIRDFCEIGRDEFDVNFGHTDLFIFATDFFPAQARGNVEALRLGKPALWIGLYRSGSAGEIVYWAPPATTACYRCICSSRYRAYYDQGSGNVNATHIPSTGGTILDLHLVDAIAGQVAVGILTAGAENRMGRLIEQLGNRNILQVKIDPEFRLGDRDIFGRYLGADPANFSFTTIALPGAGTRLPGLCKASTAWASGMRRIVRRSLIRDSAGRPLSVQSERLTDDGRGAVQQTTERTARWCSGCRRPVAELSELRGICDWCHARECCVHCISQCAVCSRRLCGQCRRGFAGPPTLTVCAVCQQRMIHRQALNDQQIAFEQELARHRLLRTTVNPILRQEGKATKAYEPDDDDPHLQRSRRRPRRPQHTNED